MKLGPFEIALRSRDTASGISADNIPGNPTIPVGAYDPGRIDDLYEPPGAEENQPDRELGAAGTVNVHGFLIQEEYNRELRGLRGIKVLDRMFRSDAAVQMAYLHVTSPLKNADWSVTPYSDDPLDREVAEFVRCALFEWLNQPWQELIGQVLRYLRYGNALFEHTWQVVDKSLTFDDPENPGDTITKPSRQFLTFDRFASRLPYTIWKWYTVDGKLDGVLQRVWRNDTYVTVKIPAEQLVHFVNEREGDDWTGTSILRAAYAAWFMKSQVEKIAVIALERHGVGILNAYLPSAAHDDPAMMGRVESMLQQVRSGEYSYLIWPGPKASNQADGFEFEILSPPNHSSEFTEMLSYFRGEIMGAVLAKFAELGHGSTGARATALTSSEPWYDLLHATGDYIGEAFGVAIKRLVDANYKVDGYPKLKASDIESRSIQQFAAGVAQLLAAGGINPDTSFRNWIREAIDAPDEDKLPDDVETDALGNPVNPPAAPFGLDDIGPDRRDGGGGFGPPDGEKAPPDAPPPRKNGTRPANTEPLLDRRP